MPGGDKKTCTAKDCYRKALMLGEAANYKGDLLPPALCPEHGRKRKETLQVRSLEATRVPSIGIQNF